MDWCCERGRLGCDDLAALGQVVRDSRCGPLTLLGPERPSSGTRGTLERGFWYRTVDSLTHAPFDMAA